ncbi:37S ribosomal protein S22 [Xylographa opegraphella]|nr:37S ribosomal protein S22 [Xylographa opegraphella]
MLLSRLERSICKSCRSRLLLLVVEGLTVSFRAQRTQQIITSNIELSTGGQRFYHRSHAQFRTLESLTEKAHEHRESDNRRSSAEIEISVRRARQVFGETLPTNFLSPDEYNVYERLYGAPLRQARPEGVDPQASVAKVIEEVDRDTRSVLMKENAHGNLEEVEYEEDAEISLDELPDRRKLEPAGGSRDQIEAPLMVYPRLAAHTSASGCEEAPLFSTGKPRTTEMEDSNNANSPYLESHEQQDIEDNGDEFFDDLSLRAHPLTIAGRFTTSPATMHLPRQGLVHPVDAMLSNLSWKHLIDVAERTFGGPGLPDSTATAYRKGHLQQKPVALEASQSKMSDMEADVYMAAIMPGAYAAVMSTLIETRRRLGSHWLVSLLKKPGGSRVLDTGAGGAGIVAWREIVRAEWERLHPDRLIEGIEPPFGKATVITGSPELRRRASRLLDNTTFLPRLPDYVPARDLPPTSQGDASTRKQYDVIIAPHTLWTLKEDYMRKSQVQNLWALLNPDGGVLIIIEKGVPRGFELVAGAREVLLKNQISSPGMEQVENEQHNTSETRFAKKESGMIIAPCTNHAQCPMYTVPGRSKGRKDHCHFSQRFIRPAYLQQILGGRGRNHEDICFSYIAVQRGEDQRQRESVKQGDPATLAAFAGYGDHDSVTVSSSQSLKEEGSLCQPHMLALPRTIMPPLKRKGHVTLDVCTPSGQLERWTVPKSFSKQAYRDARKSKWGDLWALGAKTRVLRQARVGHLKDGKKPPRVIKVDVGAHESQDRVREASTKQNQYTKRDKKGMRQRKVVDGDL